MRRTLALTVLLAACAQPFGVRKINDEIWFERESSTALNANRVSERTHQFLRRETLLDQYKKDPARLIRDLDRRLVDRKERAICFALAELCYLEGKRHGEETPDGAAFYFGGAVYAYAFLFDETLRPEVNEFDPTFRWACDLYNRGLAKVVAYSVAHPAPQPGEPRPWSLVCGDVIVLPPKSALSWDAREFDEFHVAYDYEVKGLPGSARTYGLGVPTILVRSPKDLAARTRRELFLPTIRQSYAGTLVAYFEGSVTDRTRPLEMAIEVVDPLLRSEVEHRGRTVPIESDLTIAIAHMLRNAPDPGGLKAMRDPEEYPTGLTMLAPYQPGKIPVVFVHGLMSSPLTWIPMFNDLLADPVLRERYQFWFFMYPTGNPVLYSAAQLRKALRTAQETYDPEGNDPAFNRMVLCGHSMGGLLSRTCVHTSGDRLWKRLHVDEFDLADDDVEFVRELLHFERLPFVDRVVFMATPHRGSKLATGFVGWLGSSLIRLPKRFATLADRIEESASRETAAQLHGDARKAITGVGNLSPKSVGLIEVASWPYPDDLPIHCIIGDKREAGQTGGTDGVVPYWSSHLDGVESELVIRSDHSVHWKQPAIKEVRRILLEHLGAEEFASLRPPPVEAPALR
jgi:pimeloyl-ACP methyl ester carboxylesterase